MVKTFESVDGKINIEADVIVLGCTLPGVVAAHKLKTKFGDSMDIVVLDLFGNVTRTPTTQSVGFAEAPEPDAESQASVDYIPKREENNITRVYLMKYAKEFNLPLPDSIMYPEEPYRTPGLYLMDSDTEPSQPESMESIPLQKLFQYPNGSTVEFLNNVHDFEYLNFLEKFELNKYQEALDRRMKDLFSNANSENDAEETKIWLRYDQTTMENNICEALLFSTSREIMRIIVRLVCGAPANSVSLLFYLYQCYRTNSAKNHLGGVNTRFREKLLGHCKKRISTKLRDSIKDIIFPAKPIAEIRTISRQVILKTIKTTYICNLLAMALKPDELSDIPLNDRVLSEENREITRGIKPGRAIKFHIQYTENFWSRQGYSGDIFSIRGPIIWAMERPILSNTGSLEKYSGLIGYLMVQEDDKDCKEAVLEQLVSMFGSEAAEPVSYKQTPIADVYIPRCGDYVALRRWTRGRSHENLEWGALDIFADGDLGSALEAGHSTYLRLMAYLRPQALSFDDYVVCALPMHSKNTMYSWWSHVNVINGLKLTVFAAAVCIAIKLLRVYKSK